MPLETVSLLLAVRSLVSMGSPLYGALADRFGRRTLMLVGLVALVLGAIAVGMASTLAIGWSRSPCWASANPATILPRRRTWATPCPTSAAVAC